MDNLGPTRSSDSPQGNGSGRTLNIALVRAPDVYGEALKQALEAVEPDFRVTTAASVEDALAVIENGAEIDVILVIAEDHLGDCRQCLDCIGVFGEKQPDVAVLVLCGVDPCPHARAAADHYYVKGFMTPAASLARLAGALRVIGEGGTCFPASAVLAAGAPPSRELPVTLDHAHLSPRQQEVFVLLCDGKSNKDIARSLGLAESTVKLHVRAIFGKLNVRNRTQAVLKATELVDLAQETAVRTV